MDPVEAYDRWHNWRVEGTASQLSSVLARLDVNLPAGWRKPNREEVPELASLLKDGASAYCLDATPAHIAVSLSIVPVRDTALRGGQVWFGGIRRPPAKSELPAVWEQILQFLDQGIKPAAEGLRVCITVPSKADLFLAELSFDVRERLETFSSRADKTLPLRRNTLELWHQFVVAAFRAKTRIDGDSLRQWLLLAGWPSEAAYELPLRFYEQCMLLARYTEELAAV